MTKKKKKNNDKNEKIEINEDFLQGKTKLTWKIVSLIFLALLLISFWQILIPGRMLDCGDQILGYPYKAFAANSLKSGDGLPLWNQYIFSGFPYLEAMHGDILYPSALLRLFLPVEYVIALIFFIHFFLAGIFSFLFARKLGANQHESLIIGILYMFTGIVISQVNPGHDGKVIVEAFTPAIFLLITKGVEDKKFLPYILAGGLIGLCLLAPNVQLTYYLLVGIFIYFTSELIGKYKKDFKGYIPHVIYAAISLSIGFAISSAQFIPFIKYSPLSPRGEEKGWAFATSWSMPLREFYDTFIGGFSGLKEKYWGDNYFKLHNEYMGIIPFLLAPIAFIKSKNNNLRRAVTFAGIAIFFLLVSFGGNTPIYKVFYNILPGFKKFRAPSISFFMFTFPIIALAAIGLKNLRVNKKAMNYLLVSAIIIFLILIIAIPIANNFAKDSSKISLAEANSGELKKGVFISLLVLLSVTGLLFFSRKNKKYTSIFLLIIALIAFGDLYNVNGNFVNTKKEDDKLISAKDIYGPDKIIEKIHEIDNLGRVMPTGYFDLKIAQGNVYQVDNHSNDNFLMANNILSAGGYHGNQLQRYQEFLGLSKTLMFSNSLLNHNINLARGLGIKYYPMSSLVYNELLRISQQDPDQLGNFALNVGLGKADLIRIFEGQIYDLDNMILIVDTLAQNKIYCVENVKVFENDTTLLEYIHNEEFDFSNEVVLNSFENNQNNLTVGKALINEYTSDRIIASIITEGPTIAIINDNWAPGWKATLNGEKSEVLRAYHTLRAVYIPKAGEYELIMEYKPKSVKLGFIVSSFAIFLWVVGVIFGIIQKRKLNN